MRRAMNRSVAVCLSLLCGAAACLSGCAALTVDVDVYKGPLSNHEAVQDEQIKATIIGVKPILVALRNELHGKRIPPQYQYCFWPNPTDPRERWLDDPNAVRVNAVLSLYCGLAPEGLDEYVLHIQTHIDAFTVAQGIFEPHAQSDSGAWAVVDANCCDDNSLKKHAAVSYVLQQLVSLHEERTDLDDKIKTLRKENTIFTDEMSGAQDKTAKDSLQQKIDANKAVIRELGPKIAFLDAQKQHLQEVENLLRDGYVLLRDGYQELLDPCSVGLNARWSDCIATGHNHIGEAYSLLPELSQEIPFPAESMQTDANGRFEALQDAELVKLHLRFLWNAKLAGQAETDTVMMVNQIADAFLDSRRNVEETLRVGLDLIDYLASRRNLSVSDRRCLEATENFTLSLIKCKALAAAVEKPDASQATATLRTRLNKTLDRRFTSDKKWDDEAIEPWQEALRLLFEKDPEATSRQLRVAHLSFVDGSYDVPEDHPHAAYVTDSSRRFGICLSSWEQKKAPGNPNPFDEVRRAHSGWEDSISGAAGLERGRLPQGLEMLIDDCLKRRVDLLKNVPPTEQEKELREAESKLADALVGFGEKVLVIANYEALLRDRSKKTDKDKIERIRRYTDVLQAVGNSVLVQANELRAKAEHKERLQSAQARESGAIQHAFEDDLPDKFGAGSSDAKQVLDDLIAVVRYEYAAAVKENGADANDAKHIAEALKTLYEQRADMVYLRPSSAYLRSSYPAASLQRNPQQMGNRNMLLENLVSPPPSREEQRTLWDIDKQYWQNVNQIRVSATGGSNYVVAKDDVGNWYIKSFSGDPNCIIQSAQSAAMLTGVGTGDIRSAAELATGQGKGKTQTAANAPATGEVAQIKRIHEAYRKQLQADIAAMVKDANALAGRIRSQWAEHPDTKDHATKLNPALSEPEAAMKKTLGGSLGATEAEQLTAVLKAIEKFGDQADSAVAGVSLDGQNANEPARKTARTTAKTTVRSVLLRWIDRRTTAVRDYETMLLALADAGDKPAP